MPDNIVEIDETYCGGKEGNKHLNKRVANTQGRSVKVKPRSWRSAKARECDCNGCL